MNLTQFRIRATLVVTFFLASFVKSNGQNPPIFDYIYKFNNETAHLSDNALVRGGTVLYNIRYDGGINGGGSIFQNQTRRFGV